MSNLIDRQAAIRWVKTECNPYGNPTLDFETGKKVIEHLKQMSSAQPEIIKCKDCIKREICRTTNIWAVTPDDDWFCADAERRTDE